jgi:hypothetical protein
MHGARFGVALRFFIPRVPRVISPLFGSVLGPLTVPHLRFQTPGFRSVHWRNGLPFNFGKARPAQGHLESPGLFLFAHLRFALPSNFSSDMTATSSSALQFFAFLRKICLRVTSIVKALLVL